MCEECVCVWTIHYELYDVSITFYYYILCVWTIVASVTTEQHGRCQHKVHMSNAGHTNWSPHRGMLKTTETNDSPQERCTYFGTFNQTEIKPNAGWGPASHEKE